MQYILMDIEGTTTPIDFVQKTLFPYASIHLPEYIRQNSTDPRVEACIADVITTSMQETRLTIDSDEAVHMLMKWIQDDRKHPALKELQGMIWEEGYRSKAFVSEIYPDVVPAWKKWQTEGRRLGIYSSGSIKAQKLLFSHTPEGDLTPFLSHYFDTGIGAKQEVASYENIVAALEIEAAQVHFLSDVPAELDAAKAAGMQTTQLVRPGTEASDAHPTAKSFADIA